MTPVPAAADDSGGTGEGPLVVGVDVGGTKVLGGLVDVDGRAHRVHRVPTPSLSAAETADAAVAVVRRLQVDNEVVAVGLGAAGLVDAARTGVAFAPNLVWRDEPLRDQIAERVGLPVVVENDANAAAWAEHRFGAGRGAQHLLLLTLGTGIGAGVVLGGRLLRGASGAAGEPGHVRHVPDGWRCGCGNRGCWEQYASGRAVVRAAREIALQAPTYGHRLLHAVDGDVEALDGSVVTALAREGDAAARECVEQVGRALGVGLADLVAVLDPEVVLVGGGLSDAGDLLLDPARAALAASLLGRGYREPPRLLRAALGPAAGLVGAADLARRALFARDRVDHRQADRGGPVPEPPTTGPDGSATTEPPGDGATRPSGPATPGRPGPDVP